MDTDAIPNLIHCRTCNQDLPLSAFVKNGKRLKMCAGCRAKRTGPRKKDEPATKGAANPSPALIALDVCQAEQILTAIGDNP
jgi:hypothetical protein